MSDRSTEQAALERANLDARIAFVAASFLLAYAFAALLDRVGAPERFVGAAPPYFTILGLATLGFLLHSMRASVYYTAGRGLPAAYAGFANAAIVIALMLPFGSRLAGGSWAIGAVAGVFIGLAAAGLYVGPLLRKTGVFSISELLCARFASAATRVGFIGAVALSSTLLAAAGGLIAVNALVEHTGANRGFAAFLIAAASLIIAGPGGLSGVMWGAAAAAGVATLGFGWPIAALSLHDALPSGLIFGGGASAEAAKLLESWGVTPTPMGLPVEFVTTIAVALGIATLAPVLAASVATADGRSARRAGISALFWSVVIALLAAAAIAASALSLARATAGQPPERLPQAIYQASERGLLSVCGYYVRGPSEAQRACAAKGYAPGAPLAAEEIRPIDGDFLLGALPQAAELGAASSGLIASALVALGLALATAGLQACATAFGHDALYRLRGEIDLTSRRLAVNRVTLVIVSTLAYVTAVTGVFTPGALVAAALAVSAACLAPPLALAFWARAGDREALVALCGGAVGLFTALAVAGSPNRIEIYALCALAGITLGGALGLLSGLTSRSDKPAARAFITRMLRGDAQMLQPDKGA
ncbi:sodium:solute symporter [Methylocystis sp. SB2]|uniref:sodium:solute symporter n=1 Tax=Methylocystis sp. (strain SB2) TaxID=743836 RepID=UPI001EFB3F57|nr:sodium:solute symporter [Methylocystis sp. SB2]ULO25215.1 sodium:solute symporter [Methylocystis sp. SB2]